MQKNLRLMRREASEARGAWHEARDRANETKSKADIDEAAARKNAWCELSKRIELAEEEEGLAEMKNRRKPPQGFSIPGSGSGARVALSVSPPKPLKRPVFTKTKPGGPDRGGMSR
jgi:hypothetical protein